MIRTYSQSTDLIRISEINSEKEQGTVYTV